MQKIDPSSVRLVDGFKIRCTMDSDFAIFHCHSTSASLFCPKYYIPQGEWWLDERFRAEKGFLIKAENLEFSRPASIRREPTRRLYVKQHMIERGKIPPFVLRKERRRGVHVMIVDGSIVRRHIDPEFVFGGHDFVYSYIPKGQIWLEDCMNPKEIPFVFEHEFLERRLMSKGKDYDNAHEYATIADREARRRFGIGCFPGDAKYLWARMPNKDIAKKFYVKSALHLHADPTQHSGAEAHDAFSQTTTPVWEGIFRKTLNLFGK